MNSGQEASPDSDAGAAEGDTEILEGDTEALERSQDAIEEGREAVREALKDDAPDADSAEPLESDSE
jgi:hypothetical protein